MENEQDLEKAAVRFVPSKDSIWGEIERDYYVPTYVHLGDGYIQVAFDGQEPPLALYTDTGIEQQTSQLVSQLVGKLLGRIGWSEQGAQDPPLFDFDSSFDGLGVEWELDAETGKLRCLDETLLADLKKQVVQNDLSDECVSGRDEAAD